MSEIVMIVGSQASGKTTQVDTYTAKGYVRLNRDTEGGTYAGLLAKMKGVLVSGQDIVLDNVFSTPADRKPFIEAAKAKGYAVKAVVMGATIEDAQYNVCQRMIRKYGKLLGPDDFKTVKDPNVFPPAVLYKFRKEYKSPDTGEGFDSIDFIPFTRQKTAGYTNKAIILDKDGTLTECISGDKFPCHRDDVKVLKGRGEKLAALKKQGYLLLGVSNQSGVSKGQISLTELSHIFAKTNELIGQDVDWNFCPHRIPPVSCYCRKPGPGLGVLFIERYKLDASQCIMVGDMTTDKTFAQRCGFKYETADKFF